MNHSCFLLPVSYWEHWAGQGPGPPSQQLPLRCDQLGWGCFEFVLPWQRAPSCIMDDHMIIEIHHLIPDLIISHSIFTLYIHSTVYIHSITAATAGTLMLAVAAAGVLTLAAFREV